MFERLRERERERERQRETERDRERQRETETEREREIIMQSRKTLELSNAALEKPLRGGVERIMF